MRWVLIKPFNYSSFYDPEVQEPLGLEYLASALKASKCAVMLLDSVLDNLDDRKLARRAASFQPDAIGFSITTDSSLDSVKTIYEEFKSVSGKPALWIAGGNYITTECRNAARELPAEIRIVKYEADLYIREFVAVWRQGTVAALPRVIEANPPDDLDALPFPVRSYHQIIKAEYGGAFNIQGSRGCCSACRYCASRGMRGNKPAWRGRSPENVVDELTMLYHKYNARTFNFVDEDFLGPPSGAAKRAIAIANGIKYNNLKISFGIQVRPNAMSEEIIDILHEAGLGYVFMGIESDDPCDFRRWGRAYCDRVWQWVDYLHLHDIEVNAGTLMFHQHCTFASIRRFATLLHNHGLLNFRTVINRLDAMPGSYFYEQYVAENKNVPDNGSIALPFPEQKMEDFYQSVREILAPLEAPSMHTMCALPIAQTNRMISGDDVPYRQLKALNTACDNRVADCFFVWLDRFEQDGYSSPKMDELQAENLRFARQIASQLLSSNLIMDADMLRNAMDTTS
jgi:hypothetical protein